MTANHCFISSRDVSGANVGLSGPEHHHLSRVARMRPGDEVRLFDETGTMYTARIAALGADATDLVILS